MKAIVTQAIFTGFSSKADKSLSFRGVTPELTSVEKVALMDLQNLNVRILIEPSDYQPEAKLIVKADIGLKSASDRLRAVLFILYKQEGEPGLFQSFYEAKMEKYIEHAKGKINPE